MNAAIEKQLVEILEKLKEIELALSEFYSTCAIFFNDLDVFFDILSNEEQKHAQLISELIDTVHNGKLEGVPGRFKLPTLEVYLKGIRASVEKVKQGKISTSRQALIMARDYEQSLVEKNFFEAIQSTSKEYGSVKLLLSLETKDHYQRILDRIGSLS